jgi:ArsR family transcriptional regulator
MRDPRRHFSAGIGIDPVADGVCVLQISELLGVNQSTASTYMSILRDAGLVTAARVGKYTLYKRNEQAVAEVAAAILRNL